jgi:alanine racemase
MHMDVQESKTLSSNAMLRVDLDAIARNWQKLRDRVEPATCAAVVKANAYGLGIAKVAPRLWAAGCRWFFVATLEEAIELRGILDEARIAVLSCYTQGAEVELISYNLVPVLNEPGDIHRWALAARAASRKLPAILHIDTGMSRLGLSPAQVEELAKEPGRLSGIDLRFVMSHLASAEETENPQNRLQLSRLQTVLGKLPSARACFANSSGIFLGKEYAFDMVRPGIALYGGNPTPGTDNPMSPVVRLSARILQLRDIPSGASVGYGGTWVAERPSRIATIGLGYADGFLRSGSGKGHVAFGDLLAPIVGRISMDLTGIDVTDIPVEACRTGDYVEIIGNHRSVDDVADDHGTICYEVLTSLGNRYRRVYETSAHYI